MTDRSVFTEHFVCGDAHVVVCNEFGPFGEVIRATGPMAKNNPFRFSTKYQDDETDLVYYGYRYYIPNTGRWLSRDPINEAGFNVLARQVGSFQRIEEQNLYAFVTEDAPNFIDKLGLDGGWGSFPPLWNLPPVTPPLPLVIQVCIRPLQALKCTTCIVHCFILESDGTTYSYDNHGLRSDPDSNSPKRKCVTISPSSITAAAIANQADADKSSGNWNGSNYGLLSHNCCMWVDHLLKSLGSAGVESYFPGYSLP